MLQSPFPGTLIHQISALGAGDGQGAGRARGVGFGGAAAVM